MKMENQFWELLYDWESQCKGMSQKEFRHNVELHYDDKKKKWVHRSEYTGNIWPSGFPCRSYRTAKRHLRNHDEIPIGTRFRLVGKFVGCDRYSTKK